MRNCPLQSLQRREETTPQYAHQNNECKLVRNPDMICRTQDLSIPGRLVFHTILDLDGETHQILISWEDAEDTTAHTLDCRE